MICAGECGRDLPVFTLDATGVCLMCLRDIARAEEEAAEAVAAARIENVRLRMIARIRIAAAGVIERALPVWKQVNLLRDREHASGEARAAIDAKFAWIDAVRAESDAREGAVGAAVTAEAVDAIALDAWPAFPS